MHGFAAEEPEFNLQPGILPSSLALKSLVPTIQERYPLLCSLAVDVKFKLVCHTREETMFDFWNARYTDLSKVNISRSTKHVNSTTTAPEDTADALWTQHISWESIREAYTLECANCNAYWDLIDSSWDRIFPAAAQDAEPLLA